MAKFQVSQAKIELGAKRPRKAIRAKFTRGRPTSFIQKNRRGNAVSTGALRDSLGYEIKKVKGGFKIPFKGLDYAVDVEKGQFPFKYGIASRPNKVSQAKIRRWVKARGIRPRDIERGGFIPNTPQNRESMIYLITRSLKWFGREPLPFMKTARRSAENKYMKELQAAYRADMSQLIQQSFKK